MSDLLTIQYNIINGLGKYNTNPLRDEFKQRVEVSQNKCPLSGNKVSGVVFWNRDYRGDTRGLRVVKYIRLDMDEDDDGVVI